MRFPDIKEDPEIATLVNILKDKINDGSLPIKLDGAEIGSLILFLSIENSVFKSDLEIREVLSSFIDHFIKVTNLRHWICSTDNKVKVIITDEYLWNSKYIREETQFQRKDRASSVLINLEVSKAGVESKEELIAVMRPIDTVCIDNSIDLKEEPKEDKEHNSEISTTVKQENWENFLKIAILVDDHLKDILVSLIECDLRVKHLTFEQFLNKNQHNIYHMCYDFGRCCRCLQAVSQKQSSRVLFPMHMEILFDKSNKLPGHRLSHGPTFCCSFAKAGISTDVLDVMLARCLLINFCADLFWYGCLQSQGPSFEDFLTQNKHLLYHLWQNNTKCCQCPSPLQIPVNRQIVNEKQWTDMFTTSLTATPCRQSSPSTNCICSISVIPGIIQDDLDPVLQHTLLQYCCSTLKSVETLMKIRRNVYGHMEKAQITDLDYDSYKNDIESAVLNLAVICGNEQEVKMALNDLKLRHLDYSLLVKYKDSLSNSIDDLTDVNALVHTVQNAVEQQTTKIQKIEQTKKSSFHDTTESKNGDEIRLTKLRKPIDITGSDIRYEESAQNTVDHTSAKIRRFKKNTQKSCQVLSLKLDSMEVAIPTKQEIVSRQEMSKRSRLLGLTQIEIEEHLKKCTFVETPALQACIKLLETNSLLILTGAAGTGKSRNSLEILHQFRVKHPEYESVKLTDLHDFTDFVPVEEKLVILFEDIFGRTHTRFIENTDVQIFDRLHACTIKGNNKIILTVRDTVRMSCGWVFNSHTIFHGKCEVDLSSQEFKMTKIEKELLLLKYFVANNIRLLDFNDQENFNEEAILDPQITATVNRVTLHNIVETEPLFGFPEACSLFTGNRKLTRLGLHFFKHPSKYLYEEIEKLRKNGKDNEQDRMSYVTLIYILLNDDVLDPDDIELEICFEILVSCYGISNKKLPACHIIDAANEMIGRYLIFHCDAGTYHFQHETIFECILISYSRVDPGLILSRLNFGFIREMVQLQNYTVREEEIVMKISTKYYSILANRIIEIIMSEHFNRSLSLNIQLLCESEVIRQNDECFMKYLIQKAHDAYFQPDYDLQTFVTYRGVCKLCKLYLPAYLLERITQQNQMNDSITLLVDHITLMLNSENEEDIEFVCKSSLLDAFLNVCNLENNENILDNIWVSVMSLNMSEVTEYVRSSINRVCSRCPMTTMKWMLNNIDRRKFDMNQLLKRACEFKRLDIVQFLCENINHYQLDFTAAFVAAMNNVWNDADESVSKWLIKNIDIQLFDMKTITSEVLEVGCNKDLKFLLKNVDNCMLDIKLVFNKIYKGGRRSIESLLKWMGTNVEKKKMNTLEMASMACMVEDFEVVKYLFKNIDLGPLDVKFVLMSSMNSKWQGDNKDLIQWICLNVDLKQINIMDIIDTAFKEVRYDELKILLKNNKEILNTVLRNACKNKQLELIKILLSVDDHNKLNMREAVRSVCVLEKMELLEFFLNNVDHRLYDVHHVLKESCRYGWVHIVKWLLDNIEHSSLDINTSMHTVLHREFLGPDNTLVRLLLQYPILDTVDVTEIIQECCWWGILNLVQLICEKKDHKQLDMKEAMNIACSRSHFDLVEWMLANIENNLFDMPTAFDKAIHADCDDLNASLITLLIGYTDHKLIDMANLLKIGCKQGWYDIVDWVLGNADHKV
ncbi:unnamed protein product [Mytilus coruscus]|uniref:Novel STAND NTPase 3 domain-containing protein n=1 Tax=Mytilus coruscus TaxID=42192 RepID=A0A6J8DGU6_MYTCO|nr:unnamed protein product [Mytilus coruscus]